jgi:hypothetical protein
MWPFSAWRSTTISGTWLLATLTTGCATVPLDPSKVVVIAEPLTVACGDRIQDFPVRLVIRNEGKGTLHLALDDESGPPYELNWLDWELLSGDSMDTDFQHGAGGHGPMPGAHLSIGAGDSARLEVAVYGLDPIAANSSFRVAVKDDDGNTYVTNPFRACLPVAPK